MLHRIQGIVRAREKIMVTLTITDTALRITADDVDEIVDARDMHEVLEHDLCNGWEEIQPEEVGALTSGMLLSNDVERDDSGNLVTIGNVFWDSRYAVKDAREELIRYGFVEFARHLGFTVQRAGVS
jgi:hypothetical protein